MAATATAAVASAMAWGIPGAAGAGFDITSLTVSNDDAGLLTFRVGLPAGRTAARSPTA
jgi:hypothetical protein